MTIEQMIQKKREMGLSYGKIAELSGLPLGTVQKALGGITKVPRQATLLALEKAFYPAYDYQRAADRTSCKNTMMVKEAVAAYQYQNKRQGEYTLEDYYALPDERRAELIDGVIYDMSSPTLVHQDIAGSVAFQLKEQIHRRGGNCKVRFAPVDVQLDCDDKTMVQPDVLILCDRDKERRWGILGAPDFVLEVVLDSTKKKDYFIKMAKYMNAGVKEYWIINPFSKELTTYDFTGEEGPRVYSLSGKQGLALYHGEIMIDLDEVAAEILEYPDQENLY